MSHVVSRPHPPFRALGGALEVHQIPAATDNLIWLLVCTETGEAAAVDGPGAGEVVAYAERLGVRLRTILNTHTHGDHVGINAELLAADALDGWRVIGPAKVARKVPGLTDPVDEGDEITVGRVPGRVWSTEGHLDGHISFVFADERGDGAVFCGDTLFTGGCGYLFDGPPAKMYASLMRLASLPGGTRVCCAHEYTQDNLRFAWSVEPDNEALADRIRRVWAIRADGGCAVPSTIEEERATNPFLRPGAPTLLARVRAELPDADLSTGEGVFTATRALKDLKRYRAPTDADLPLSR